MVLVLFTGAGFSFLISVLSECSATSLFFGVLTVTASWTIGRHVSFRLLVNPKYHLSMFRFGTIHVGFSLSLELDDMCTISWCPVFCPLAESCLRPDFLTSLLAFVFSAGK